jgi:hypothetical protein
METLVRLFQNWGMTPMLTADGATMGKYGGIAGQAVD